MGTRRRPGHLLQKKRIILNELKTTTKQINKRNAEKKMNRVKGKCGDLDEGSELRITMGEQHWSKSDVCTESS